MIKMKKTKKPGKHIEFKEPSLSELLKDEKLKEQKSPCIKHDAPAKNIESKKLRCSTKKLIDKLRKEFNDIIIQNGKVLD